MEINEEDNNKFSFGNFIVCINFCNCCRGKYFQCKTLQSDAELYGKFTAKTGIKVNLINGKSGALEKRIIEEGADSSADLYITADAGRCGAMDAKGCFNLV